jgi:hypothetical protein
MTQVTPCWVFSPLCASAPSILPHSYVFLDEGRASRSGQSPLLSAYTRGPTAAVGPTTSRIACTPVGTRMGQTREGISMSR